MERQLFRRESLEYELKLARDAYGCACTVVARLTMRMEIARLESELMAFPASVVVNGGA